MAIITSGSQADVQALIDATSKAMRVTNYSSVGRDISFRSSPAFCCTIQAVAAVATPTDVFTISGSPNKIVRVLSLCHATTTTAAGSVRFFLIRRFSPDYSTTATLPVPIPAVSLDTQYGPTATCLTFTANPPQLGGLVGPMNIKTTLTNLLVPGSWGQLAFGFNTFAPDASNAVEMIPGNKLMTTDNDITLRGPSEVLALNFNSAALVGGQIMWITCMWTETDK